MVGPEFWWGTVSSSLQAEGAAPASTWRRWEQEERVPPSRDGNGFGTNFRDELGLLASLGLTHVRLTLEWARLEPAPGKVDGEAVERYIAILEAAKAAGVAVWATLHHTTLPGWFEIDERGFVDDRSRTYLWPGHVDRMGEWFGDLVAGWVPIHEPLAYATAGWLTGTRPPGRRDPEQFARAHRAVLLAMLEAWRLLRSGGRPVATALDLAPVEPAVTSREPDERDAASAAARRLDRLIWSVPIRLLRDGILAVPGLPEEEIDGAAGAFDLIGCTYEQARSVFADGSTGPYPADARVGPTGSAPWAEGLGLTLRRLADELPRRPLLVAGHGIATPADDPHQDEWREEQLRATFLQLDRAVHDGIDVRGYFHRTGVDGYEAEHGFAVQYGVIDIDRRPKPSAQLLAHAAGGTPAPSP